MEKKIEELNDDALKDVNGGGWLNKDLFYSSGEVPAYKLGDSVTIVPRAFSTFVGSKLRVIGVSSVKSGLFRKEFTYTVQRLSDGKTQDNVYESELRPEA